METIDTLALTLGAGWAAGINLYAAVLVLGYLGMTGHVTLPPGLEVLSDPLVMAIAGIMYFIEFFADKTPGVDSGWDALHTFVRIPAGALLAAGAASGFEVNQAAELAAALVGGTMAAGSHFTKAGTRLMINTSPEPVTNWTASIAEDLAVIAGLWAALNHPVAFILLLALFIAMVIWLLPKIWRALKSLFRRIGALFAKEPPPPDSPLGSKSEHPDVLKSLFHSANSDQGMEK
ncbi:MAG: DUF4126 domain-containing protein [gamma proteobacterium symbiont of Ctena orbiculata]|nr:DUF4126 domain-containing protein [Candidatus Thiodiazotropha taylori]MBT3060014.1 DUF4126 domain-containing protein [Candidatus Thiodiazotropha sp. (ex Lucina pensylvanica)]MBT3062314.1 DUF4126 domain-containing protein [Candidatus Thiodiazotropha sp. (ex Lucina pensylvanica)]PUB71760.1 MAG: DUF4126 domain-containing protein [gamma proteobacterium symbiont of Ctena orbiculata]PUB79130.1 MAG: DUF4126 domain-containing protein [gamma proteobacterium symbiont of Ctena orbiculata]